MSKGKIVAALGGAFLAALTLVPAGASAGDLNVVYLFKGQDECSVANVKMVESLKDSVYAASACAPDDQYGGWSFHVSPL